MGILSSIVGGLVGAGGNILGDIASSAYGAHISRDLMNVQNRYNVANWRMQLGEGPTLQREGLEKAGYNPLLALTGFQVPSIGGVSIPSVNGSAKNIGTSAMQAADTASQIAQREVQTENISADTGVKEAQKAELEASKDLKEAQEQKTKVDTVVEPIRAANAVGGSIVTAYGAKKAYDAFKQAAAGNKNVKKVLGSIPKKDRPFDIPLKRTSYGIGAHTLLALPYVLGAGSAYGLHKLYQHSEEDSNVRKIMDNPEKLWHSPLR